MTFALGHRAHNATNSLHSLVYFVPETDEYLSAIGLRAGRMCYFAGRAAPMGAVGPGVVTATFYNFSPALVARSIPAAWDLATPKAVTDARLAAADAALTRLLGPDVIASADMITLAGLLREHRGDGHTSALLGAGLSGIEALITHTATGKGFLPEFARASRGWTRDEWEAAAAGLAARGLLDVDGALTEAGQALRAQVEDQTDRLAASPWLHLGDQGTEEVIRIGKALTRAVLAAGAFPREGVFATA